jgi:hypothetical protein
VLQLGKVNRLLLAELAGRASITKPLLPEPQAERVGWPPIATAVCGDELSR